FFDNSLSQFASEFYTAKKLIRSRKVNIKLIDRCFFKQGYALADNFSYNIRMLCISRRVAAYYDGFGTKLPCLAHRHGRVYSKFARFVATRGHHSPVGHAANKHGLSVKPTIEKPLYRYKESIEIEVGNGRVARLLSRIKL